MKLRDIKPGSSFRLPNGDVLIKGHDIEDRTPFNGTPGLHARCFFSIKPISGYVPTSRDAFWVSENLDVDLLSALN